VVNGIVNGAVTGGKKGGNYSQLKRGELLRGVDHWGLSMAWKEGGTVARA
jgi:hypothetical protein